ncbi:hypothetical protein QE372_004929 [Agrobacterium pusense]|nr:hypothetical protein [Agrobacterium pusense]
MRFLRDNGLTITLLALSILTIGGMLLTGWGVHNEELAEHGARPLDGDEPAVKKSERRRVE